MKIYDISLAISPDMPVWPGDPAVVLRRVESMDTGAHANVSALQCSVHTGTHVDAPHHFLNDGRTVEGMPLEVLVGPARVVEIPPEVRLISAVVLESVELPRGTKRILLKTRNSAFWNESAQRFHEDFTAIAPDGAEWLSAKGIQLVGIDYLSVAPYGDSTPTHRVLLQAGIILLEGIDLGEVTPGEYDLYCLPLKLAGSDGAPARAILIG